MTEYNRPEALIFQGNLSVNFDIFEREFNTYMVASEKDTKPESVKVAILLNIIGKDARQKYYTWDISRVPEDKLNLEDVIKAFRDYCNPRSNEICQRIKFYNRKQKANESFDDFLTDLRKLADTCNFGSQKDAMIRDFVLQSIRSKELRNTLMDIEDLTLEQAINKCRIVDLEDNRSKEAQQFRQPKFTTNFRKSNKKQNNDNNNCTVTDQPLISSNNLNQTPSNPFPINWRTPIGDPSNQYSNNSPFN